MSEDSELTRLGKAVAITIGGLKVALVILFLLVFLAGLL